MVAQVFSFKRQEPAVADWTRDEIAELYRIEHALLQSGLMLEVERGVTDEGDPWFAFCRSDGEVLIHLARYDGLYRLHSAALSSPLIGRSFVELTKAFSNQVPLQITLQRNSGPRVFVHPAAMLAVVIGTIFVASNEVVFSPQTTDSDKKTDDVSEAASPHKALLQSTFQLYIDNFFSWLRDGAIFQQAAHLTLISTIAAFIVGSDTATDTDQARDGLTPDGHSTHNQTNGTAAADGALLAPPGPSSDTSHSMAVTDRSAEHVSLLHQQDSAFLGGEDGQKTQETAALVEQARGEVVANYGATPDSNKTADVATNTASDVTPSDILTVNAASEGNTASVLQPDAALFSSTAIAGETAITATNSGQGEKLDVALSGGSQSIDLTDSVATHDLVLSGNGDVYVSGITASGPLSVYVTSGSQQELFLSYQAAMSGSSVTQTVTLSGADTVLLTEALKASSATVQLTVDSEGTQANTLNLADLASQGTTPTGGTFEIKLVGAQDLTLNESAATFTNSTLDGSGLAGNLTVGIDFGASVSVTDLTLGASNFVVNESDSVALVDLANNSQIVLDTSLDTVILSMAPNSGPGSASLDMQPSSQAAIEINVINAVGLASLSIDSNSGGPRQANEVLALADPNLSVLTIAGSGALTIGSIYGIAAFDNQNITIDAHALSAPFTVDVSGINDVSGGGRVITIIGGSDGSVLTNMVASEDTVFTGGAGVNTFNIGGGAALDTITDLKPTDTVNIGSAGFTDGFANGLSLNSAAQSLVNSQGDLVDAALTASKLLGDVLAHQAVLFSYQGSQYVFISSDGGNLFDASTDAIVKVVGLSAGVSLADVFHSA